MSEKEQVHKKWAITNFCPFIFLKKLVRTETLVCRTMECHKSHILQKRQTPQMTVSIWFCNVILIMGRVVRKPINANPGLNVNQSNKFSCIKMYFTDDVLCSLRLFKLKTEGQTIQTEKLNKKLQIHNQNSR